MFSLKKPEPIDHIRHVNSADHNVNVQLVYNDPAHKSATINVESPIGKNIDSRFVFFKEKVVRFSEVTPEGKEISK